MTLRIKPALSTDFPRLAWIADVSFSRDEVRVLHGDGVEVGDDFLVEGCWPGEFEHLEFHRCDGFFGSGMRLVADSIYVVPSCSLTDRVFLSEASNRILISNSLVLILSASGCTLSSVTDYRPVCHAILAGVDSYQAEFPTTSSECHLRQIYYHPVRLHANGSEVISRGDPGKFQCFSEYEDALLDTLCAIRDNCHSHFRKTPVASWSMASTGYDSTAVSALARDLSVPAVFVTCGDVTLDGAPLEDGRAIARSLGMEAKALRPKVLTRDFELLCLASTCDGRECAFADMFDHAAASKAVGCMWSGYHGDKIWDRATSGRYLDSGIIRGDTSGLNLSEIRLCCGFFNLAVPFLFARAIKDIVTIANSSEMMRWQIGGDYDRPIPRRIAETRGVPRDAFGQKKSVVMQYYTYPRNPQLNREFLAFLSDSGFGPVRRSLYRVAEEWDYRAPSALRLNRLSLRDRLRPGAQDLPNTLFTWSVNSLVHSVGEVF